MAAIADAGTGWFLSAHPSPDRLAVEWAEHPKWTGQLPAGRMWDAVAMPYLLGLDVRGVCRTLKGCYPPALVDRWNRRLYLFIEPDQGGVWAEDIWTLPRESWLTVPHPQYGPYDCPTWWLQRPNAADELLSAVELRTAVRLALPAYRRRAVSAPVDGGVL
ncbi:hypothetical protein AB0I86_32275 [Streptomyces sp. NPDC049950]|uniref:hypothetical protein n=1 Tax=Streptomyces sp. NPDC049950 TaxID=3156659 RepID=UPI0034435A86